MYTNTHSNHEKINALDNRRGRIVSNTGGWFPGKGVFCHGYSMLDEFVGTKSYFQVLILNATGRLVERPLADWLEARYICMSWPDPRIWCNQIGALAGAARTSAVAATTVGTLAADSRSYGQFTIIAGITFIQTARQQQLDGLSPEQIVRKVTEANRGKPYITGYIRPIAKGDERIVAMERVTAQLGFSVGPHLALAYAISQVLMDKFDEGMNINGYVSAFLSDQGFSAMEVYQMQSVLVSSGVTACYLDTLKQPLDSFTPLRCADVDYQGHVKRSVPDAG